PGAITLDIGLPDMAGWTILDRLKHDPATRHIPVHIISGDENRRRGLALGAISFLEKAAAKDSLADTFAAIGESTRTRVKKLLVACDDPARRHTIVEMVAAPDLEIAEASNATEALAVAAEHSPEMIIVHQEMEAMSGLQLAADLRQRRGAMTPILVFCTRP